MLQGLALPAAFDQLTESTFFFARKRALEIQIQLHARDFKQVRQQEFRLEPRGIDTFFCKELGAALNDFENGHRKGVSTVTKSQSGCLLPLWMKKLTG